MLTRCTDDDEEDDDNFLRRLIMCEEDRCRLFPTSTWTGSFRWFRAANIIDLQRYRGPVEKDRIRAMLLQRGD
jgi:hypothetical protein